MRVENLPKITDVMKKWKTKNGYEIYLVSSGRSNVYLISTGKGNILVDTGWKYSYPGL